MRRSTGHLCACTSMDVERVLGEVLERAVSPTSLARLEVTVAGKKLAPALNDVLIAHPSPGAVSRYSVHVGGGAPDNVLDIDGNSEEAAATAAAAAAAAAAGSGSGSGSSAAGAPPLWFHVRSSGLRTCTASGSTVRTVSFTNDSITVKP